MANGGWVGTFEDITEREHAAEELSEQYRRFDAALENMAHGLCMFDKDWRVIVHNQRFLELYGLRPEAVQPGTPLVDLVRFSLGEARPRFAPTRPPRRCSRISSGGSRTGRMASRRWCAASPMGA